MVKNEFSQYHSNLTDIIFPTTVKFTLCLIYRYKITYQDSTKILQLRYLLNECFASATTFLLMATALGPASRCMTAHLGNYDSTPKEATIVAVIAIIVFPKVIIIVAVIITAIPTAVVILISDTSATTAIFELRPTTTSEQAAINYSVHKHISEPQGNSLPTNSTLSLRTTLAERTAVYSHVEMQSKKESPHR